MTEKIGLEALLKDDQFQAGLKRYMQGLDAMVNGGQTMIAASEKLATATDKTGQQAEKSAKSWHELEAQINTIQNAFGQVKAVFQEGLGLAQLGAQAERVEQRFNALAAQAGGADVMLAAFQEGAGGAASKMEAMSAASKLLQMGLVDDADGMKRVVEMATRLGDQTQSVSNRIFDFALMLTNQSVMRLDNFGISSGRVRARIKELQDATEGLSREQAFMQATLEIGGASLEILGERVEDNAMAFEKAQAKMADARVELGKKLAPAFAAVMNVVSNLHGTTIMLVGVLGSLLATLIKIGPVIKQLAATLGTSALALGALLVAIPLLVAAFELLMKVVDKINEAQQAATDAAAEMGKEMRNLVSQGTELGDAMLMLSDKSNEMSRIWNSNIVTGTALGGIFGAHGKYLETAAAVTAEVNQTALEGTSTWEEYARAIDGYNARVDDAALKVTALNDKERLYAVSTLPAVMEAAAGADQAMLNHVAAIEAGIVKTADWVEKIEYTTGQLQGMQNATESYDQAMFNHVAAIQAGIVLTDEHQIAISNNYFALQQQEAALEAEKLAQEEANQAAEEARARLEELVDAHNRATQAAFDQVNASLSLAESLSDLDAKQTARAAIDQLEELFSAGVISISQYDEQVRIIQDTFGLVSEEGRFLAEGLQLLKDAIADGKIVTDDYNTILGEMQTMAEEGDLDIDKLKETMGKYEQPTKTAAERTRDMREELAEADEPTTTLEEHTRDLTKAQEGMIISADDLTGAEGDASGATAELAQKMLEAQGPADEFLARLEVLPDEAKDAAEGMTGAGQAFVRNFQAGFNAAWPAFLANFRAKLAQLEADLPGSRPDDPSSPLYHLYEQGEAIAGEILRGFEAGEIPLAAELEAWQNRVSGYFDIGRVFGGLGGTAAQDVSNQVKDLGQELDQMTRYLLNVPKDLGWDATFDDVGALQLAMEEWLRRYPSMMRWAAMTGQSTQELRAQYRLIMDTLPLFDQRNDLAQEYNDLNAQLLEFQEKQQQLRFLEQQLKLLELIQTYGLDAQDILGDLRLGIDADMTAVMNAMTGAMQAIIDRINDELQISSPSKVMQRIGRHMMEGMTMGIAEGLYAPSRLMTAPALAAGGAGGLASVDQSRNITINAGGNTITSPAQAAAFDERIRRIVRQEVRGY